MVLAAFSLAVILISIAIYSQRDRIRFLFFSVFQLAVFSPVFLLGADQGRWIALTLSSALVMLVESHPCVTVNVSPSLRRLASAYSALPRHSILISQIGLAFWGFPLVGWSLQKYLWSTPVGTVFLKTYFVVRTLDFSALMT
jgi:hypothetical protein